jgi:arylsulfatase A-like enzyme
VVTVFWQNDGLTNVSVYWDTHNRNFIDLKTRLMPAADQAFSALLDDLEARGLLDETLVVWTGEFGRTPRVGQSVVGGAGAGRDGRDHWPHCFSTVMAGAGIRGGVVHGASDRWAAHPALDPVTPADVVATVYHALGVDPMTELRDALGRPQALCLGQPIVPVLA